MRILCLGVNHKTADVSLRERLAFDAEGARRALAELRANWPGSEFLVLSTCNRTELYTVRPVHGHPRDEQLRQWLAVSRGVPVDDLSSVAYTLVNADAVRHLFHVAAGLDSLVPGEDQIVAQVKDAYQGAAQADSTGGALSDIFETALHVAKHVRAETEISVGKVSVASVAVDFAASVFESLAGKHVLSVGAGKMNALMLKQLAAGGAADIVVANRSAQRAEELAGACGGRATTLDDLEDTLARADVVLTGTAADSAVITRTMVADAQDRRGWRPLLIVDVAVPRDVAAEAGDLENVFLYNIDDLDQIVRETLRVRNSRRTEAEEIIEEHVGELTARLHVRYVAPTIDALYKSMEKIAMEELTDARNKLSNHDDAEEDMQILRRTMHRTIRRFLHPCTSQLRESAGSDAAGAHVAAVRRLFRLDEVET